MPKNWYLVNIAGNFFSNQPRLKGTVMHNRKKFYKSSNFQNISFATFILLRQQHPDSPFMENIDWIPMVLITIIWTTSHSALEPWLVGKKFVSYVD